MNIFDEIQKRLHERLKRHEEATRACVKKYNYLGAALSARHENECQEAIKIVREVEKEYTVPCTICKYNPENNNAEGEEMNLIEEILDTLVEVGNGVTEEMLREAADKLFIVRAILERRNNYTEKENELASYIDYNFVDTLRPVVRKLSEITGKPYEDYIEKAKNIVLDGNDRTETLCYFDTQLLEARRKANTSGSST